MNADLKENLAKVNDRIDAAAKKSGRTKDDIRLVAVTKWVSVEKIKEAIEFGITDIGENRIQEAQSKYGQLSSYNINWHLIGHLQRNKVKTALAIFELIHSVDSLKLAKEINGVAAIEGKRVEVLVEVNTSGELSKYGTTLNELEELLNNISEMENIRVSGLMTMAPFTTNPQSSRPYFRLLRELSEKMKTLRIGNVTIKYLSMGTSQDYDVAIEEGANIVRVGSSIFSKKE